MPAEVTTSQPSAAAIAWNWIIEELADCKEIETSILAEVVKRNRSGIEDPYHGDSARRRIALRCLEDLAESTDVVSLETPANPLSHGTKFVGLNIPGDILSKSSRHDLCQLIQQRRDALPKSSLDQMKHDILKESENISKRLKSNTHEPYTQKCLIPDKVQVREGSISGKPTDEDQTIVSDSTSDDKDLNENETPDLHPLKDGHQTGQRLCVICDQGGDLLMCTGSICPMAIHPACLGSDFSLNKPEDFKCPLCFYSQAASEYNEARKKYSAAKKALSEFLDKRVKPANLERETRVSEKPPNASTQAEPPEQERVDLFFPSSEVRDEEPQEQVENGLKDKDNGRKEDDNGIKKTDLGVDDGKMLSSSKYRKQRTVAGKPKRYANPIIPCGRRNRLPWTKEEEAMLKEAMQKFHPNQESKNSDISWITIWEYGQHVFHRTRQPMDLKDKWRNIKLRRGQ